jgi:hypothetical protein
VGSERKGVAMILVRDVFRLRFGAAKEARALLKQRAEIMGRAGLAPTRQLMDLTGRYYTLVIESTHPNLGSWEDAVGKAHADPMWAVWFEKFKPLVDSGSREIFTILDAR